MPYFHVRLFGDLEIVRQGHPLPGAPSRSPASLLALLLVNRGHPVARSTVAAAMWPEASSREARKALRTTLWRLGTALTGEDAEAPDPVVAERDHVRLADPEAWSVDLWPFEDRLECLVRQGREIEGDDEARSVREALDLHRRPFLESFPDRWCEDRRHRSRLMWLTALEALVRYRRRTAQWKSVLLEADLVLRVDPLRETMHRELMHAHYARGDRASSLRLYERYRVLLRDELGVSPMSLTRELHDRILKGVTVPELTSLLEA